MFRTRSGALLEQNHILRKKNKINESNRCEEDASSRVNK